MPKKIILLSLAVILIGVLIPFTFQLFNPLQTEVANNYRSAYEPFGKLLLAAQETDKVENYTSRCNPVHKPVFVKTFFWMMIPGPVLEACLVTDEQGNTVGIKSVGVVARN